jgi:hypothetical protein
MLRLITPLIALCLTNPAFALEVKSCEDANAGIAEIVQPAGNNSRSFSEDRVSLYAIDIVEPVCCAGGVAIVMPDTEDEVGANKCYAVVGVASVQLDKATAEQDTGKTLRISIPTRVFNGSEEATSGDPIKLRIDVERSQLELE